MAGGRSLPLLGGLRMDAAVRGGTLVRASRVRWSVLAIISLMYMVTYIDRSNISVAAPAIARELSLSKIELGLVFSAFIWAYAIGQVPGGWLADRFGPRR